MRAVFEKIFVLVSLLIATSFGVPGFVNDVYAGLKVYDPYVEKGEMEFESKGNIDFDKDAEKDGLQKQKYSLGYGMTDYWSTEMVGEVEKERNDDNEDLNFRFTELEWENKFQLTKPGKYPVDVGFLLEYGASFEDKHADKMEWALLLDKSIGKVENIANFTLAHEVGGGHTNETSGEFAWASRYFVNYHIQPGFEYHADFGGLNEGKSFKEQIHQIGPVLHGKIVRHFSYDIGYLFGLSDAAPQGTFKWIIELAHDF